MCCTHVCVVRLLPMVHRMSTLAQHCFPYSQLLWFPCMYHCMCYCRNHSDVSLHVPLHTPLTAILRIIVCITVGFIVCILYCTYDCMHCMLCTIHSVCICMYACRGSGFASRNPKLFNPMNRGSPLAKRLRRAANPHHRLSRFLV